MNQYSAFTSATIARSVQKAAAAAPMLDKDHELDLAQRWRDDRDESALKELTRSYLRLVLAIAKKFKNYGLPLSDIVQEGSVGLMQAAARFEPAREIRFSTYAAWWIRSSIQDYVLRNWSIVRTGTTAAHKSLFFNFRRLRASLTSNYDAPLGLDERQELADILNVRLKDVEIMEARLSSPDHSLNAPVSDHEANGEWQDKLVDSRPQPEAQIREGHDSKVRSNLIANALKGLNQREKSIIQERRLTDDGATLAAMGKKMGISKERVRQIETVALDKLKQAIIKEAGTNGQLDASILI
jgi:RNA polymerase sigma-32 factor